MAVVAHASVVDIKYRLNRRYILRACTPSPSRLFCFRRGRCQQLGVGRRAHTAAGNNAAHKSGCFVAKCIRGRVEVSGPTDKRGIRLPQVGLRDNIRRMPDGMAEKKKRQPIMKAPALHPEYNTIMSNAGRDDDLASGIRMGNQTTGGVCSTCIDSLPVRYCLLINEWLPELRQTEATLNTNNVPA